MPIVKNAQLHEALLDNKVFQNKSVLCPAFGEENYIRPDELCFEMTVYKILNLGWHRLPSNTNNKSFSIRTQPVI